MVQLGEVRITVLAADPAEVAARAEARIGMARVKAAKKKAEKTPPGVWAPAGAKAGAGTGSKARVKAGARVAPGSGAPVGVKSRKKSNVFADKAEAHRRNRKT